METLTKDIRHAIRSLIRYPAFTVIAVVTLALGIGANTAIFSVVNALLLRPLPFTEPDKLMQVWEVGLKHDQRHDVAYPNFCRLARSEPIIPADRRLFGSDIQFNRRG